MLPFVLAPRDTPSNLVSSIIMLSWSTIKLPSKFVNGIPSLAIISSNPVKDANCNNLVRNDASFILKFLTIKFPE